MIITAWILVISGMTTLLVAANSRKKQHLCKEVLFNIKGSGEELYIEQEDLLQLINQTTHGSPVGKPLTAINLSGIEKTLEGNSWVKNAELYFDSKDALHVLVEERTPIARIFTNSGSSFYMDSSGCRMPLLEKFSIRLPVVTGFISPKKMTALDSNLLQQVKQVAGFIFENEFWNEQIGQIDITPERKFELIPVIGNHVIRLGDGNDVEDKLNRLQVFYQQVMTKTGFNKYSALDLEFKGQVVAVKKGPVSAVDSVQLQKNIEELITKANQQNIDQEMEAGTNHPEQTDSTASITTPAKSVPAKTNPNPAALSPSDPEKGNVSNPEKVKPTIPDPKTNKRPKAVMRRLPH